MQYYMSHPVAGVSRVMENLLIAGKRSDWFVINALCRLGASVLGVTLLPGALSAKLVFLVGKAVKAYYYRNSSPEHQDKFQKQIEKIYVCALGILASPAALYSPDAVSSFFLKAPHLDPNIRPFGGEPVPVEQIYYPETVSDLKTLLALGKKISIVGAGMQTLPGKDPCIVINVSQLKNITIEEETFDVQAGATWKEVQEALDRAGKSLLVKPVFDDFSVGGSIAANVHGLAHEVGTIASVVESLTVMNGKGEEIVLSRDDEYFKCFFGTFGWFGIILGAKIRCVKNTVLTKITKEIAVSDLNDFYQKEISGRGFPFFEAIVEQDPGRVRLVYYAQATGKSDIEKSGSRRLEEMAFHLFGYLPKEDAKTVTRNWALRPSIHAGKILRRSRLRAQLFQEYFVVPEGLTTFLDYLGKECREHGLQIRHTAIRPVSTDTVSWIPYAERMRYGVMICLDQVRTAAQQEKIHRCLQKISDYVDVRPHPAYMPFSAGKQLQGVDRLRDLKEKYDPDNIFGNAHTAHFFEKIN